MLPIRFIATVPQFTVPDVVVAAEYYRDVLGFEISGYWTGTEVTNEPKTPPVLGIVGRDDVEVFFSRADGPITRTRAPGAYDVYIRINGVDEFAADLRARGAEIVDGPDDRVYGQREVVVRDCNGLVLCFGENINQDQAADGHA